MKIKRLDFHLQHFCILAIALAAIVLLNTARICVMAISYSQYMFWHQGFGLVSLEGSCHSDSTRSSISNSQVANIPASTSITGQNNGGHHPPD